MTTPIYKATIGAYIRQVEALSEILVKGREHFAANGIDADAFINESLIEDMNPFSFQIRTVCHQANCVESLKSGRASPPPAIDVSDYATLESMLKDAAETLRATTPEELDGMLDNDVVFAFGEVKIPFKALGYLTSFASTNFYFHVTTAYNLLRRKGVPIGKRDFLGALDMNFG